MDERYHRRTTSQSSLSVSTLATCWPATIAPRLNKMHAQGKRATASPPNNGPAPRRTWFTQNMMHGPPCSGRAPTPAPQREKSGLRPGDHPRPASSQAPRRKRHLHLFAPIDTPPPTEQTRIARRLSDGLIGKTPEKTDTQERQGLQRRSPTLLHFDRRRAGERWQLGSAENELLPEAHDSPIPSRQADITHESKHRRMRPAPSHAPHARL
ncbi:hypothetical protein P171DRAFT_488756 [Karstenula rhodostoma CBS 690.94]|uniref:Uncharacterized protein n=1 Tax=Karstenula rhodostoma CBS 690.94 TaxID=1392251 RepID=A0A9P4PC00_9PLEO|nr:hypothetical protein P171DRAFT_488756 [Karstenula rhodostoma CBS 690.94]